jgi:tetratricopeptide (TPR) repeat protein
VLPGARANAAAALKNLAHARFRLAGDCGKFRHRLRIARADRIFHQALSLAPDSARGAMEFERGEIRYGGKRKQCVASYCAAVRVEPENPVYWAHLARAQATHGAPKDEARHSCEMTLETLAQVFRRTLEPHCLTPQMLARNDAIKALKEACGLLGLEPMGTRVAALRPLARMIVEAESARPRNVRELAKLWRDTEPDDWWRREQVGLALARCLGANGKWASAARGYGRLIDHLEEKRPAAIRQHALHAKHAKALRRAGMKHEALESAARGLLLDPISAVARRELGKAHFSLLQYEEAREAWQHTLWLTPNDATLHFKAGFSLWSTAQDRQDPDERTEALAEAAVDLERSAELFGIENVPGWAWSRLWLGRVYGELGKHDLAVRHFRAAKGCAVTELAARIFLAELNERNGRGGLAAYQFEKARTVLCDVITASALTIRALFAQRCDEDWGNTLSYREVAARIHLGQGRDALAARNDHDEAIRHAARAHRLAVGLERQPRSKTRLLAEALELESRVDLAREKFADALEKVQRAVLLSPVPDLHLLKLTITAACAANSVRAQARAQLVAGMAADLRAIRRAEGEYGDRVATGRLIVRQWLPDDAESRNGKETLALARS